MKQLLVGDDELVAIVFQENFQKHSPGALISIDKRMILYDAQCVERRELGNVRLAMSGSVPRSPKRRS